MSSALRRCGSQFGVYGSWWFNALGLMLGLNSTAALVLRWPWKLQQMGFVIPHIGLIVLLVGCFLSRRYGVEATLVVFEGESSDLAYKGPEQHVELDGQQRFTLKVISADGTMAGEPIVVPFTSGPFNWDDYRTLGPLPWSLAHRDRGVLYDRDGIRLEVLDYLSNSTIVNVPSLSVQAAPWTGRWRGVPASGRHPTFGQGRRGATCRRPALRRRQRADAVRRPAYLVLDEARGRYGHFLVETAGAFGQARLAVLYAGGKSYDLSLGDWTPGTRRPLGDSGLEAELVGVSGATTWHRGRYR